MLKEWLILLLELELGVLLEDGVNVGVWFVKILVNFGVRLGLGVEF